MLKAKHGFFCLSLLMSVFLGARSQAFAAPLPLGVGPIATISNRLGIAGPVSVSVYEITPDLRAVFVTSGQISYGGPPLPIFKFHESCGAVNIDSLIVVFSKPGWPDDVIFDVRSEVMRFPAGWVDTEVVNNIFEINLVPDSLDIWFRRFRTPIPDLELGGGPLDLPDPFSGFGPPPE